MKRGRWARATLIVVLVVAGILMTLYAPATFTAQDLMIYRQAGVSLWGGKNPYDLPPVSSYVQQRMFGVFDSRALQIWTPPSALFIPLILGLCSEGVTILLWLLALCSCVILAADYYRRQQGDTGVFVPVAASWGLLGVPVFNVLLCGSVAPFEALPYFLLLVLLVRREKASVRALCVSLFSLSFKPQLVIAPLARYLLFAFRDRRSIGAVIAALGGSIVFMVMLLCLHPAIIEQYLQIDRTIFLEHAYYTVTLPAIFGLQPWIDPVGYCVLVLVVCGVAWAFHSVTRHLSPSRQLVEFSPLTFLVVPYCWGHDYIVLLPWMMVLLHDVRLSRHRGHRFLFGCGLILWVVGELILLFRQVGDATFYCRYPLLAGLCVWVGLRYVRLRAGIKQSVPV